MQKFVVVGGGLAGHRAALDLRKLAPAASITVFSAEPGLPYDRPPLSKKFLLGSDDAHSVVLHQADAYRALDIAYFPSTPVNAIDRARRALAANDRWFEYDALLLATGSRARRLPITVAATDAVHYLRTLEDAVRLRAALTAKRRVVIIGGGFIGLEVASSARARDCLVTVVESRSRILARGMPEVLCTWVERLHRNNGVEIVQGATVESIVADDAGGAVVRLPQGTIHADVVVAGIGVVPNTELAVDAGLLVDDGIIVDQSCRTSDPHIFAAGEVTSHPVAGNGKRHRIESWKVASEQPAIAAKSMVGLEAAFTALPWLWSDQFDVNIQALGHPDQGHSHIVRGDPTSRAWTYVSLDADERPIGAVAVNNGRDISMLRRIMVSGGRLPS